MYKKNKNKIKCKITHNGNGFVVYIDDDNAFMTGVNSIIDMLNGETNTTTLSKIATERKPLVIKHDG